MSISHNSEILSCRNNKEETPEQIFKATQMQLKSLTSPPAPTDSEETDTPQENKAIPETDYTQELPEPHYAFTHLAIITGYMEESAYLLRSS